MLNVIDNKGLVRPACNVSRNDEQSVIQSALGGALHPCFGPVHSVPLKEIIHNEEIIHDECVTSNECLPDPAWIHSTVNHAPIVLEV